MIAKRLWLALAVACGAQALVSVEVGDSRPELESADLLAFSKLIDADVESYWGGGEGRSYPTWWSSDRARETDEPKPQVIVHVKETKRKPLLTGKVRSHPKLDFVQAFG